MLDSCSNPVARGGCYRRSCVASITIQGLVMVQVVRNVRRNRQRGRISSSLHIYICVCIQQQVPRQVDAAQHESPTLLVFEVASDREDWGQLHGTPTTRTHAFHAPSGTARTRPGCICADTPPARRVKRRIMLSDGQIKDGRRDGLLRQANTSPNYIWANDDVDAMDKGSAE